MKVDKICLCFLVFFAAGLSSLAIAQRQYGGGGYTIAGYSILSRPGGLPGELPMPGGMLIGGGGFGNLNRFVIGGTGFGLLGRTFKVDGNEAQNRLTFGGGGFEFGYDVSKRKDILLNTNILIGGLGAEYQIEKEVSSIVYSNVVLYAEETQH